MAQALKKTTGLAGLAVSQAPHRYLSRLYDKILRTLEKLPKDYPYRQHTEKLVSERLAIVNTTTSVKEIEDKIGCGQLEELGVQARLEYELVRNMVQWKPWEPLIQEPPPKQWSWPPHE